MGIEVGQAWMLKRAESDVALVDENQLEEFEVITRMFPPESGPSSGHVLSNFNAASRLAVIFEEVMNLRTTFASARLREDAILAVDPVLEKWQAMLPQRLRLETQVQKPMTVIAVHAQYYCCVILLHISAAGDALKEGKTSANDYSIRRLADASSRMGDMIAREGRHFVDCVQAPLPLSFIALLLVNANDFIHTPESLAANQRVLQALIQHRAQGRSLDTNASVTHKVSLDRLSA
ncbi:hypothetical protein RQP46_000249 [Phenoliferia psychrophenolica]